MDIGEQSKTWLIEQISKMGWKETKKFYRYADDPETREAARLRLRTLLRNFILNPNKDIP